ncbi:hypothetical protein E6C50_05505 [Flavobacterium supellecticarium]|uniref:MG2 domain-containing protein n=1 Tax=Flavobacterium supellecticarium TaxID=2565924 RepID=A0A4S3ZZ25_9FLAO|nr:hypothetical protein [Flavobacterium supellecticarium]THF51228.1 hypothetical protein E6C50_05505 [Flavobacterium supellecticarium]
MRKNILPLILIGASCFFCHNSIAQGSSQKSNLTVAALERIYVHANTTMLLSGESCFYNLYCLNAGNNTSSTISKIAYIEVIDADKKSVLKQKIHLDNGVAQGDFFIPTTLKTGNYKLIAYTNWMLNNNAAAFFQLDLVVINPFLTGKNPVSKESLVVKNTNDKVTSNFMALNTDKKSYGNREKINLTINPLTNGSKGVYSLSVRKVDLLTNPSVTTPQSFISNANNTPLTGGTMHIPELRGELLSGKIMSKSGQEVQNKNIALSLPGKSFEMKMTVTDKDGNFFFALDRYPNTNNAVIQVVDAEHDDYSVVLTDMQNVDLSQLRFPEAFTLNPAYRAAIEERSTANQIENAYYSKKRDSLEIAPRTQPFYHPLQKDYFLDDYTRFSSFKETVTEVIPELFFRENKGKYSLHLRNSATNDGSIDNPLIMVDGLLIQNSDELFQYNTNNIHKISLINKAYIYGPIMYSGVVNIITKNFDYQTKASGDFIKKTEINRPQKKKTYYSPKYDGTQNLDRIPDYRYQLAWFPNLNIGQEPTTVSFYSSDIKGTFEIILEGFTEKGEPVYTKEYIEVP